MLGFSSIFKLNESQIP